MHHACRKRKSHGRGKRWSKLVVEKLSQVYEFLHINFFVSVLGVDIKCKKEMALVLSSV